MKITMRSDLIEEGLSIPDVEKDRYYTPQEIVGASFVSDNDDEGFVTVRLKTGEKAVLYSIDLDFD